MCEFISWIETAHGLCYLTDDEIFSSYARERLQGCQDNDFLGHGAIRWFYNFEYGIDHENCDFWDTSRLPAELAVKINNFDRWWGKTFSHYFQNDDLCYIIEHAPDKWRAKAAEKLLKKKPIFVF